MFGVGAGRFRVGFVILFGFGLLRSAPRRSALCPSASSPLHAERAGERAAAAMMLAHHRMRLLAAVAWQSRVLAQPAVAAVERAARMSSSRSGGSSSGKPKRAEDTARFLQGLAAEAAAGTAAPPHASFATCLSSSRVHVMVIVQSFAEARGK